MWGLKVIVLSSVMPRLFTSVDRGIGQLSMGVMHLGLLDRVDFKPISITSILFLFSLRKLVTIQVLMSWKQLMREVWGQWVWIRCTAGFFQNSSGNVCHGDA